MEAKRKDIIKAAIKRIHAGEDLEKIKADFGPAVQGLTEVEIAAVEEEAMAEGATIEDVRKLCGAHLEVFRASMKEAPLDVPAWHPLHIQDEEHIDMTNRVTLLKGQVHAIIHADPKGGSAAAQALALAIDKLRDVVAYLGRAESNFLKQENVYFPVLERHGVAQPPKIMWAEHDMLRAVQKRLAGLAAGDVAANIAQIRDAVLEYEGILFEHIMKERTVLFPASVQLFSEGEWKDVRREFDEVGYFAFFPQPLEGSSAPAAASAAGAADRDATSGAGAKDYAAGTVDLDTGYLTRDQLVAILKALPIDLSFVDADDKVKFYNDAKDRIFVRTKAVIGRSVQNCHPPKSLHVVQSILDDFRSGKKNTEDFWLKLGPKYVLIRYVAVRGEKGEYLGALETSQDIAPIQAITGEKRIMG